MGDYEMDKNYFLEYGNTIIWTNSQDKTERQIKMEVYDLINIHAICIISVFTMLLHSPATALSSSQELHLVDEIRGKCLQFLPCDAMLARY